MVDIPRATSIAEFTASVPHDLPDRREYPGTALLLEADIEAGVLSVLLPYTDFGHAVTVTLRNSLRSQDFHTHPEDDAVSHPWSSGGACTCNRCRDNCDVPRQRLTEITFD